MWPLRAKATMWVGLDEATKRCAFMSRLHIYWWIFRGNIPKDSYPLRCQFWKSVFGCVAGTRWRGVWWIHQDLRSWLPLVTYILTNILYMCDLAEQKRLDGWVLTNSQNVTPFCISLDIYWSIFNIICDGLEQKQADGWVQSPAEVCNLPHQSLSKLHTSAGNCTHPSTCFCSKRSRILLKIHQ